MNPTRHSILTQALALPVQPGERLYSGVFGGESATLSASQYGWYKAECKRAYRRELRGKGVGA